MPAPVHRALRRPVTALSISFLALAAEFGALAYAAATKADQAGRIQQSRYEGVAEIVRVAQCRPAQHRHQSAAAPPVHGRRPGARLRTDRR